MARPSADLILHPIRMRIILALGRGVPLTAAGLGDLLPDVPTATLYRHLGVLVDGGILDVVEERRVRGAVERTYALQGGNALLGPDDLASVSREDHLRYFASFAASLIDEFARYLRRDGIDLAADGVSYREISLNLSDDEYLGLLRELWGALAARVGTPSTPDRRARSIALIGIPGEPGATSASDDESGRPAARPDHPDTTEGAHS